MQRLGFSSLVMVFSIVMIGLWAPSLFAQSLEETVNSLIARADDALDELNDIERDLDDDLEELLKDGIVPARDAIPNAQDALDKLEELCDIVSFDLDTIRELTQNLLDTIDDLNINTIRFPQIQNASNLFKDAREAIIDFIQNGIDENVFDNLDNLICNKGKALDKWKDGLKSLTDGLDTLKSQFVDNLNALVADLQPLIEEIESFAGITRTLPFNFTLEEDNRRLASLAFSDFEFSTLSALNRIPNRRVADLIDQINRDRFDDAVRTVDLIGEDIDEAQRGLRAGIEDLEKMQFITLALNLLRNANGDGTLRFFWGPANAFRPTSATLGDSVRYQRWLLPNSKDQTTTLAVFIFNDSGSASQPATLELSMGSEADSILGGPFSAEIPVMEPLSVRTITFNTNAVLPDFRGDITARILFNSGLIDEATKTVNECPTPYSFSPFVGRDVSPNPLVSTVDSGEVKDFPFFPALSGQFLVDVFPPDTSYNVALTPTYELTSGFGAFTLDLASNETLYCRKPQQINWFVTRYLPFENEGQFLGAGGATDLEGNAVSATGPSLEVDLSPGIFRIERSIEFGGETVSSRSSLPLAIVPAPDLRILKVETAPSTGGLWTAETLNPNNFPKDTNVDITVRLFPVVLDFFGLSNFSSVNEMMLQGGVQFSLEVGGFTVMEAVDSLPPLIIPQPSQIDTNRRVVNLDSTLNLPVGLGIPEGGTPMRAEIFATNGALDLLNIDNALSLSCTPLWQARTKSSGIVTKTSNSGNAIFDFVMGGLFSFTAAVQRNQAAEFNAEFITISPIIKELNGKFVVTARDPINLKVETTLDLVEKMLDPATQVPCPAALRSEFDFGDGSNIAELAPQPSSTDPVTEGFVVDNNEIKIGNTEMHQFSEGNFSPALTAYLTGERNLAAELKVTGSGEFTATTRPIVLDIKPKLEGIFMSGITAISAGLSVQNRVEIPIEWNGNTPNTVTLNPSWISGNFRLTNGGTIFGPPSSPGAPPTTITVDLNKTFFDFDMSSLNLTNTNSKNILTIEAIGTDPTTNQQQSDLDSHNGSPLQKEFLGGFPGSDGPTSPVQTAKNPLLDEPQRQPDLGQRSTLLTLPEHFSGLDLQGVSMDVLSQLSAQANAKMTNAEAINQVVDDIHQNLQDQIAERIQTAFADAPDNITDDPVAFQQRIDKAMTGLDEKKIKVTRPRLASASGNALDTIRLIENGRLTLVLDRHLTESGKVNIAQGPLDFTQQPEQTPRPVLASSFQPNKVKFPLQNNTLSVLISGNSAKYKAKAEFGGAGDVDSLTPSSYQQPRGADLGGGDDQKKTSVAITAGGGFTWDSAKRSGDARGFFKITFEVPIKKKPEVIVVVEFTTDLGVNLKDFFDFNGTFAKITVKFGAKITVPTGPWPFIGKVNFEISPDLSYEIKLTYADTFSNLSKVEDAMTFQLKVWGYIDWGAFKGGPFGGGAIQSQFQPSPKFNCAKGFVGLRFEIDLWIFSGEWETAKTWTAGTCATLVTSIGELQRHGESGNLTTDSSSILEPPLSLQQTEASVNVEFEQPGELRLVMDRPYAGPDYATFVNERQASTQFGTEEIRLIENAFPYGDPQLITNGKTFVLVWMQDDLDKSISMGRELWYSTAGSDLNFGPPQRLTMDNLSDSEPSLAIDANGNVVLAWVRSKDEALLQQINSTAFGYAFRQRIGGRHFTDMPFGALNPAVRLAQTTDQPALEEIFSQLELAYAVMEPAIGTFGETAFLTNNNFLEGMVHLVTDETGNLMVVWERSEDNMPPIIVEPLAPSTLLTASWNSNTQTFGETFILREGDLATERDFAYRDGQLLYVWAEAGQTLAAFFENGVLGEITVLNNGTNNSPAAAFTPEGVPLAVWIENTTPDANEGSGSVDSRLLESKYENGVWSTEAIDLDSTTINGLQLVQDTDGNLALIWAQTSGTQSQGTDAYALIYDRANGGWSNARQLTDDIDLEEQITATLSGEDIYLTYIKQILSFETQDFMASGTDSEDPSITHNNVVFSVDNIPTIASSQLYVLRAGLNADLIVGNVVLDPAVPVPGFGVDITVSVSNAGRMGTDAAGVVVELRNESGSVIESQTVDALSIGSEAQATFTWSVPAEAVERVLTVIVNPSDTIAEARTDNNSISIPIITLDWEVSDLNLSFGQLITDEDAFEAARTELEDVTLGSLGLPSDASEEDIIAALQPLLEEINALVDTQAIATITVSNKGPIDAPEAELILSTGLDSEVFTERSGLSMLSVPALAAGESVELTFEWTLTEQPTESFKVFAAVQNLDGMSVFEVNVDNSELDTLLQFAPELSFDAVGFDENGALSGLLVNHGPTSAEAVSISVFTLDTDGNILSELTSVIVATVPGFGGQIPFSLNLPDHDASTLLVIIDPLRLLEDLDLTNNTQTVRIEGP